MQKTQKSGSNWDVDYYKTDYESEEHWNLRKSFMLAHKKKFAEDELVCLAQVFTNIEFLGCKYPDDTMRLVGELSQDVAKEFRANRAKRLKRTFIKASDAAEARAKGRTTQKQYVEVNSRRINQKNRKAFETGDLKTDNISSKHTMRNCSLFDGLEFGKFVLYLTGGRNCIRLSAQKCIMNLEERESFETGVRKKIEIFLDEKLIASASEESLKESKAKAFQLGVDFLRKNCYSVKSNDNADSIKIDKSNNQVVCGVTRQNVISEEEKRIDSNNVGYKMMKMMGWSGGGLGSKTQGREDPVGYLLKNNRAGLGNQTCKLDQSYFRQILKNYLNSNDIRDLHFAATFTKDERALLHEIAGKLGLKSTSRGKGDERSLQISKKTLTSEQILTEVLLNKTPSFCDKFFVQVPESKATLFPNYVSTLKLDF